MKHIYRSCWKVALAIFAISFSTITSQLNAGILSVSSSYPYLQNTELSLDYPEQIKAGEEFVFTVSLKNPINLLNSGTLSVNFTNGFTPLAKSIEGLSYEIENSKALFSWDRLSESNLFFISFSVKTAEKLNGVYPIRVVYRGNEAEIKENIGLYVVGKTKTSDDYIEHITERFSPVSIKLDYPEEVLLNNDYQIKIEIAKGKNTGGAEIGVHIPPSGKIFIDDTINYTYNPGSGRLQISLKNMPPNPVFTIEAMIVNNSVKKAVYPISANIVFDNRTSARFSDYIFITDQLTSTSITRSAAAEEAQQENDYSHLEETFSELDKLLQEWTASTIGITTKTEIVNEQNKESDQAPAMLQAEEIATSTSVETPKIPESTTALPKSFFFTVQIAASEVPTPGLKNFLRSMQISTPMSEDYDGELYRYIVGEFENIEKAKEFRLKMISEGFKDAFVVKYEAGKRIPPKE